jgi:hypothetical protein
MGGSDDTAPVVALLRELMVSIKRVAAVDMHQRAKLGKRLHAAHLI